LFASGVGLGMLGQKYGKEVIDIAKNMNKNTKQNNKENVK